MIPTPRELVEDIASFAILLGLMYTIWVGWHVF